MSLGSLAFIPAPPFDTIGPFRLYGLMIALGVLASVALAILVGNVALVLSVQFGWVKPQYTVG